MRVLVVEDDYELGLEVVGGFAAPSDEFGFAPSNSNPQPQKCVYI